MIHGELRFRQDPYEWVYDGLKPLLLDGLLQTHKGIHISLASLYCAVARRLGCAIYPRTAPESTFPSTTRLSDTASLMLRQALWMRRWLGL